MTFALTSLVWSAGEPREIAEIIAFLASPASSYINGAIPFANGGELSTLPG
ncbi:SDR family oxidoreductase [Actinopolymorpha sp. B9G3]|uniref:SDR family oxidoreductase n=1 Tax=Actinopolymorpha sp. B9G3 TaxID=3158970 RepID=UPI0032D8CFD1